MIDGKFVPKNYQANEALKASIDELASQVAAMGSSIDRFTHSPKPLPFRIAIGANNDWATKTKRGIIRSIANYGSAVGTLLLNDGPVAAQYSATLNLQTNLDLLANITLNPGQLSPLTYIHFHAGIWVVNASIAGFVIFGDFI